MNEEELNEKTTDEDSIDPWEAAFAAIEKAGSENESSSGESGRDGATSDAGGGEPQPEPSRTEAQAETPEPTENVLRSDSTDIQSDVPESSGQGTDATDYSFDQGSLDDIKNNARAQAIDVVAKTMKEKGYHFASNGAAGYSINDLMKRGEDGVITFINPDTGREFEGGDPRSAAKQWVDAYNSDFRDTFNAACQRVEEKIMEQYQPVINVLEFGDTYDKLDDVRKNMLDAILENYEVRQKDGTLIGFSIPMNTALSMVNSQVSRLQDLGKRMNLGNQRTPEVDMKSAAKDSGAPRKPENIKSLEDALAYQQDILLQGRKN